MSLKLITPPTQLALSVAEAKAQVRVLASAEDALIERYLHTAQGFCEQVCGGRAIMPQTWELTLDAFPEAFELTRVPAASIASIKYWDEAGAQTTLDPLAYTLDNADEIGLSYVVPAYEFPSWPTARRQVNAVALRYVAGWTNAAAVPYEIKSWIALQVGTMYENRSAEGGVQTFALGFADRLLDRYKLWGV